MYGAFARRLFAGAVAIAIALAYVQVSSVPPTAAQQASYSWDTVVGDTVADVRGLATTAREEVRWWRATYVRMSRDTRLLQQKLTVSNIENPQN